MKKISLIFVFTLMTLFAYVNNVSADTSTFEVRYDLGSGILDNASYSETKKLYEDNADTITDIIENWLTLYQDISSDYPYYWVATHWNSSTLLQLEFYTTSTSPIVPYNTQYDLHYDTINYCFLDISTSSISGTGCNSLSSSSGSSTIYYGSSSYGRIRSDRMFFSNFDLRFSSLPASITYLDFETYGSSSITRSWLQEPGSVIPTLYDYLGLSFLSEFDTDQFTEVNLNNWAYVVLSLKDYTNLISPVEFLVKGQLCATPVYDYGMREKAVTDRCSVVYSDFTPVRLYISTTDLQNKIVFYLSAFDTSIENKVKVNTRVFDISYITQDNASEPTIIVDGRPYSVIPYQDLTTSATNNEEADYIPGVTCAIGDINCQAEASGMDISDLFSKPLELLESLWSSITTFFTIITTFITILPPTLQTFLYVSFMLAVILGIIKIIIG